MPTDREKITIEQFLEKVNLRLFKETSHIHQIKVTAVVLNARGVLVGSEMRFIENEADTPTDLDRDEVNRIVAEVERHYEVGDVPTI